MDIDNENQRNGLCTKEELHGILLIAEQNAKPPRTPDQNIHSNRRARYRRNKKRRLKTSIFDRESRRINRIQEAINDNLFDRNVINKQDDISDNEDIDLPDAQELSNEQLNNLKSFFRPKFKCLNGKDQNGKQTKTNHNIDSNISSNSTNSGENSSKRNKNRVISLSHITGKKRNRNMNTNSLSMPSKKRKLSNGEIHKSRVISLRHIAI